MHCLSYCLAVNNFIKRNSSKTYNS